MSMSNNRAERRRGLLDIVDPNIAAELHIYIMKDGQTKVKGPLGNRKLCEAILQDAANVIKAFNPQTEEEEKGAPKIVTLDKQIIVPGGMGNGGRTL